MAHFVDFNALPRITRERIVNSTGSKPALAPVFADRDNWAWIYPLFVGLLVIGYFIFEMTLSGGYGRIPAQIPELIPLYMAAVFMLVAGGLGLAFQGKWRRAIPFKPGRYLFPLDFVDASSRKLRIIPLSDLADFRGTHHHTNGGYTHTSIQFLFHHHSAEEFQVKGKDQAVAMLNQLHDARSRVTQALQLADERTVREYDLFFEARNQPGGLEAFQGKPVPAADEGPRVQEPPKRFQLAGVFLIALGVSVVVGPPAWLVRNVLSDDAAFEKAKADSSNGGRALADYAREGWRHVDEARELGWQLGFQDCEKQETEQCWVNFLKAWPHSPKAEEARTERLPRAALKRSPQTVAGLTWFLEHYPGTVVEKEVREKLLPQAAFQELPVDSVSALRRFRREYPHSELDEEAQQRIRKVFAQARTNLQSQASKKNPALLPFMTQLLSHIESTEYPTVNVRFRSQASPSLRKADRLLKQSSYYDGGLAAPVSVYFEASNVSRFETSALSAMRGAFEQFFPSGLVSMHQAEALSAKQASAEPTGPEINIDYAIGWSGTAYSMDRGRRRFVGIQFDFNVNMRMPGAKPVRFSVKVKPPKDFSVQYTRPGLGSSLSFLGSDSGGPTDSAVYDIMAQRAFDELGAKLGEVFFRPQSEASVRYGNRTDP
jgi:hypothetical protein